MGIIRTAPQSKNVLPPRPHRNVAGQRQKQYNGFRRSGEAGYAKLDLPWNKMADRSILISGATGLIGSFLVDVIMKKNQEGLNCAVYALGRNEDKADSFVWANAFGI